MTTEERDPHERRAPPSLPPLAEADMDDLQKSIDDVARRGGPYVPIPARAPGRAANESVTVTLPYWKWLYFCGWLDAQKPATAANNILSDVIAAIASSVQPEPLASPYGSRLRGRFGVLSPPLG